MAKQPLNFLSILIIIIAASFITYELLSFFKDGVFNSYIFGLGFAYVIPHLVLRTLPVIFVWSVLMALGIVGLIKSRKNKITEIKI